MKNGSISEQNGSSTPTHVLRFSVQYTKHQQSRLINQLSQQPTYDSTTIFNLKVT